MFIIILTFILEKLFADKIKLKSQLDARQMVGAMIKFVLGQYGYIPDERTSIKNSSIFKLAMRYKFVPQEQKMVLVRHITSEKMSQSKSLHDGIHEEKNDAGG